MRYNPEDTPEARGLVRADPSSLHPDAIPALIRHAKEYDGCDCDCIAIYHPFFLANGDPTKIVTWHYDQCKIILATKYRLN